MPNTSELISTLGDSFLDAYLSQARAEECQNIIQISIVLKNADEAGSSLKIRSSGSIHEYRVKNVQSSCSGNFIVGLLVNEALKVVPKAVNLLPGRLERAGRLRLANTRHLDINLKLWKINSLADDPSEQRYFVCR